MSTDSIGKALADLEPEAQQAPELPVAA